MRGIVGEECDGFAGKNNKSIMEEAYEPADLQHTVEEWELFRKKRGKESTMVRRYCQTLDIDYMKNKITIVAHMNHIMDFYTFQRKPFMRTLVG